MKKQIKSSVKNDGRLTPEQRREMFEQNLKIKKLQMVEGLIMNLARNPNVKPEDILEKATAIAEAYCTENFPYVEEQTDTENE